MSDELTRLEVAAAAADALAAPEVMPEAGVSAAPAPAPGVSIEDAQKEASVLTDLMAAAAESLWPVLGFKEETKSTFAAKLAPVLRKHNFSSALGRWSEEFEFGMFAAGVVWSGVKAVRAAKLQPDKPA